MAAGFLITALGLFHMTNLDLQIDFRTAMLWRIYQVCAFGFLFVPVNTIAYTDMPPGASNQVSALTNVMRNLGGSFGISAATTILARHQQVHQAYLVRNAFQYNPKLQRILTQLTDLFSGRTGPEHAMQQSTRQGVHDPGAPSLSARLYRRVLDDGSALPSRNRAPILRREGEAGASRHGALKALTCIPQLTTIG
jgi:hypothetical protein